MVHEKTSDTHQNRKIRKIRKTQVPVPNGRDGICDRSQGGHLKKKNEKEMVLNWLSNRSTTSPSHAFSPWIPPTYCLLLVSPEAPDSFLMNLWEPWYNTWFKQTLQQNLNMIQTKCREWFKQKLLKKYHSSKNWKKVFKQDLQKCFKPNWWMSCVKKIKDAPVSSWSF